MCSNDLHYVHSPKGNPVGVFSLRKTHVPYEADSASQYISRSVAPNKVDHFFASQKGDGLFDFHIGVFIGAFFLKQKNRAGTLGGFI
jgi:hypothetical protein